MDNLLLQIKLKYSIMNFKDIEGTGLKKILLIKVGNRIRRFS